MYPDRRLSFVAFVLFELSLMTTRGQFLYGETSGTDLFRQRVTINS